jgi:hypothetical protein
MNEELQQELLLIDQFAAEAMKIFLAQAVRDKTALKFESSENNALDDIASNSYYLATRMLEWRAERHKHYFRLPIGSDE